MEFQFFELYKFRSPRNHEQPKCYRDGKPERNSSADVPRYWKRDTYDEVV